MTETILGIDPGLANVGWGSVRADLTGATWGVIRTQPGLDQADRLHLIYSSVKDLLWNNPPQGVGIEKVYFNNNVSSAMTTAMVIGVVSVVAKSFGIPVYLVTPQQWKAGVGVHGGTKNKRMIQQAIKRILGLPKIPTPNHAADALGIAIYTETVNRLDRLTVVE